MAAGHGANAVRRGTRALAACALLAAVIPAAVARETPAKGPVAVPASVKLYFADQDRALVLDILKNVLAETGA